MALSVCFRNSSSCSKMMQAVTTGGPLVFFRMIPGLGGFQNACGCSTILLCYIQEPLAERNFSGCQPSVMSHTSRNSSISSQGGAELDAWAASHDNASLKLHPLPPILSGRLDPLHRKCRRNFSPSSLPAKISWPNGAELYISPLWIPEHGEMLPSRNPWSRDNSWNEKSSSSYLSSSNPASTFSRITSRESYTSIDTSTTTDSTQLVLIEKEDENKVKDEVFVQEANTDIVFKGQTFLRSTYNRLELYTFQEIQDATNQFSIDLKLGEGRYGSVYKGRLEFKNVAIKVLRLKQFEYSSEFRHEVETLCCLRHPNIVSLLGLYPEGPYLVYEYVPNGNLADRLTCSRGTTPLPWYTRFQIAAEISSALHFLHGQKPEPTVHQNLKPENVLFDYNDVSKLADVGHARLVSEYSDRRNGTRHQETIPVDAFAYIDPEYQKTGCFDLKSDIYALGIVMLQLLTGKPPLGVHEFVETAIEEGTFSDVLDHSAGAWPVAKAKEVAMLALRCAEMKRKQRPLLESVILVLDKIRVFAAEFAAMD